MNLMKGLEQNRAKNLSAEKLLIEIMGVKGDSFSAKQRLNIPITKAVKNDPSATNVRMR